MGNEFHPPFRGPRQPGAELVGSEGPADVKTGSPVKMTAPPVISSSERRDADGSGRLVSMDAFRGFVMVCLAANGFGLAVAAKNFPDSSIWQAIGHQFEHVAWVGCSFWDLIQPSFMFLVGVALPYSYARREESGDSSLSMFGHALSRSVLLILLGLFLSSIGKPTTEFNFMNVLTQIGLGYPVVFLLRNRSIVIQLVAVTVILGGYWAWFAMTPVEQVENPKSVQLEGYEAHWQKNANPAAKFDRWLLNLFPTKEPAPAAKPADTTHTDAVPSDKTSTNETPADVAPADGAPTDASSTEAVKEASTEPLTDAPKAVEENFTPEDAAGVSTESPQEVPTDALSDAPAEVPKDEAAKEVVPVATKTEEKKPTGFLEKASAIVLRLVTRPAPYLSNEGGYQTLNFIPSIVTMLIGLMTGEFIRRNGDRRGRVFVGMLLAGLMLLGAGWAWHAFGGCPLVKRIWTPSWTLFSTGWTLVIMSAFYGVIDGIGLRFWSFPFVVAGMNSMVLYLSGRLLHGWTVDLLKRHVNENLFQAFGDAYAPILEANLVLLCLWLFVYWLYRQRIFVRI